MLLGKLGLLGVVLYFVGRAMARQLAEIPWEDVQFRAGWLGLSLVTICVATFVSTISFSLLFARSGHAPGLGPVCAATWLSVAGQVRAGQVRGYCECNVAAEPIGRTGRYRGERMAAATGDHHTERAADGDPAVSLGALRGRFPLAWVFVAGGAVVLVVILHPRVWDGESTGCSCG